MRVFLGELSVSPGCLPCDLLDLDAEPDLSHGNGRVPCGRRGAIRSSAPSAIDFEQKIQENPTYT